MKLRAFNLLEGMAFLAGDEVAVAMTVDRNLDLEVVAVEFRLVDGRVGDQTFDFCEVMVVLGACVNPTDLDDWDLGTDAA
jgi:hypothetical protein